MYLFATAKGTRKENHFIFYDSSGPICKLQEFAELILFAPNKDTKKVNPTFSPKLKNESNFLRAADTLLTSHPQS